MNILILTPEVSPFSSSGELGELAGALPRALQEAGARVTVVTPFHGCIEPDRFGLARRIRKLAVPLGGDTVELGIVDGKFRSCDVPVIFLDHPESFAREGLYGSPAGGPYRDNHRRFYLLARGALAAVRELGIEVDLVHALGWQSAFLPLLARLGAAPELAGAPIVFGLHQLDPASLLPSAALDELRLGHDLFNPEGIEFHGQVSLIKAGLLYSSRVTTWSPAFARALQRDEHGEGLLGVFRVVAERTDGVLPGLDPESWNPAADHRLAERYDADTLPGKEACKRALQTELGLPVRPQPLIVMPGPLTDDRGADLVARSLPALLQRKLQLALLGPAPDALATVLREAATANPQVLVYREAEPMLQRVLAGADAVLSPQRHDPDGLGLIKALRYGAVPIAHAAGAARDAVVDLDPRSVTGTGVLFGTRDADSLTGAVQRLLEAHEQRRVWSTLVRSGMRSSQTWEAPAQRLLEIYGRALAARA